MKFTGYGIIWNPKTCRPLVNFKNTPEYETNDYEEIEILLKCDHITSKSGDIIKKEIPKEIPEEIIIDEVAEDKPLTKKDVMESLDASGIDYNPRDKKEVLLSLIEG